MSILEHSRFRIINPHQHPYHHAAADVAYACAAAPGMVYNLEQALGLLFATLFPKPKDAVAVPGDLPLVGNEINDYRFVMDDGDGKSAGYRFFQIDGETGPSWHKTIDVDWGYDSVLSAFLTSTQDQYVAKYGRDDRDATGVTLIGDVAGQHVYGGAGPNTHLTLFANNGDGSGPSTGFVQVGDNFRPLHDSQFSIGTDTYRFLKGWFDEIQVGSLNFQAGEISDSTGEISFGVCNLATNGTVTADSFHAGSLSIEGGLVTDTSGTLGFDCDLVVVGSVDAVMFSATDLPSVFCTGTGIGTLTLADASITDSSGAISFGTNNLHGTGQLTFGALNVDAVRIDGDSVFSTILDHDLILAANGTGKVKLSSTLSGSVAQFSSGMQIGGLWFDAYGISGISGDTNVSLFPTGTGRVRAGGNLCPTTDGTFDLGGVSNCWGELYLNNGISNGTLSITMASLLAFRDSCGNANVGDVLFWTGNQWIPSAPDTEIDHSKISTLTTGDSGHTQFVMLAGRAGGQSILGGTLASQNLTLQSTGHATRGSIVVNDVLIPGVATVDLGTAVNPWRDLFVSGQLHGARLENFTTAGRPAASVGTIGRMYWDTTISDIVVDGGGTWFSKSIDRYVYQDASGWASGTATDVTYTVDGSVTPARGAVSDARLCHWELRSNADGFRAVGVDFVLTQTTVQVLSDVALPAGTYTLIGLG